LLATQEPAKTAVPEPTIDLASLFKPGVLFQDRNGDEVIDFVDGRIVLGEAPTVREIVAAAGVAARLGFETTAINLPLPRGVAGPGVPIVIGRGGLARAKLSAAELGIERLKPGEALVAASQAAGKPAVVIVGADDAGTLAAAELFAGRLPHAWDLKGPTLEKVAGDLREYLAGRGVSAAVEIPAAYVQTGTGGIRRLVARARVASRGDVAKAQLALQALAREREPAGATRTAAKPAPGPKAEAAPLSYTGVDMLRVRLDAEGAPAPWVDVPALRKREAAEPPLPRRPGSGAKENLDLSTLYSIDGGLGDSDNNLIPDRVDLLLSPAGEGTLGTIDLAARIGLESAGIAIPVAVPPEALDAGAGESPGRPESQPTLVLIGTSHPVVERLVREGKVELPDLRPGEGLIQVVKKAFGEAGSEKGAVIVTGGDARGVARALAQATERLPHLWARGKDRATVDDVEEHVRRLLSARSPAGQAATALYKLERLLSELAGKDLESAHVKVFVEKAEDGLADLVRREATARIKARKLDVTIQNLDVQKAKPVSVEGQPVDAEFDVPSEVDDFWRLLRSRVVPAVRKARGRPVHVEARLSEPPEVRARLERDAREELLRAGARDLSVRVLSAYKQGYSWLYDAVRPQLAGKPIERIRIRFAEVGPPPEWKQQATYAPTRWLLEAFPIDEVLARDLKLDPKQVSFEKTEVGSPAYEVIVTAPGGAVLLRQTFEPKFVVRSFFDQFPDYEKVRVTTGWLTATVGGRPVVDERIVTDPERFWDHFQGRTLPAIYKHVMAVSKGKPRPEDAPFFGELRVELSLSEPDYSIGIDQELISSMEAIHEEVYFNTLHFFDLLGRFARGTALAYPGRVIPIVRPKADGKAGHARITFTGFDSPRPGVVVEYRERGSPERELRLDVPRVAVERPSALRALVREGHEGLERLDLRVKVDTEKDERAELVKRASEERVDRQILSAEQVKAVAANLDRLRAAGLYRDALAYHGLGTLRIVAGWEHESRPQAEVAHALESAGVPEPPPDIKKLLPPGWRHVAGRPLVQWDTPIPPPEAYEILAKMSTFPEATVYKVGESYLGRDIWAMDLMPKVEASHWSQAKATTTRPTVVYSARQHANEVSSTSHVLKLAELLLTDPEFQPKLRKVNVVIHPVTNPDGAQLAYDLQEITPNHMLHAGYLGSLGVDVTAGQNDPDPIYPETRVRPEIWRTWLPDIFLNPHGYPTHEWVQLFSEYAAWVRTRAVESRDYWSMRGWWMPGFGYLDDPRYPRHKAEQFKLLGMITANIKAAPDVWALNQRAYERYARYTFAFDQKNFKLDFTDGVLVYKSLKGARAEQRGASGPGGTGGQGSFMTRYPNVTIWEGSTEAPDETARGDWLKLVATAGLQWDKASLQYLFEGRHVVERKADPFWGGVSLSMNRPRPPKPPAAKKAGETVAPTQQQ
jgi:hypothetical protein